MRPCCEEPFASHIFGLPLVVCARPLLSSRSLQPDLKDSTYVGPGFPNEEEKKQVLARLAKLRDWLKEDKSWRCTSQFCLQGKQTKRFERVNRTLLQQHLRRIYVLPEANADVDYPVTCYIPSGPQDVPPLRGRIVAQELFATIFFKAARMQRLGKSKKSSLELLAEVAPHLIDENVLKPGVFVEVMNLAQLVLVHKLNWEEPNV